MYLDFYGLSESPFNLTPDANFLYPSRVHREVLAHLLYGVNSRKGFIMVTGEVGSGKTTLCRALLKKLGPDTDVALVLNSFLSEEELLKTINEELGIASNGKSKKELIDELNNFLLQQRMKGRNVVLIIDEAQNLSFPVLEQIRMLSNLETEKEKLLQIVLVGQPELRRLIGSPRLRQLSQRITVRHHITPLSRDESIQYIYHRLEVAGRRAATGGAEPSETARGTSGNIVFTNGALGEVHRFSRGIPRMINVICDQALLAGYVANSMRIDRKMILAAETEMKGVGESRSRQRFLGGEFSLVHVGAWAGLVVALGLIGLSLYSVITGKTLLPRGTARFASAYAGKTDSSPSNGDARKGVIPAPSLTKSAAEELPSLVRLAFHNGATSRVGDMLPASLGANMVPLFAQDPFLLSILPPRPNVKLEKPTAAAEREPEHEHSLPSGVLETATQPGQSEPAPRVETVDNKVVAYRSLVEPLCTLLRLWNKPPVVIEAVRERYNEVGGHLPNLAAAAEMGWLSCRADLEKLRQIDIPVIVEIIGDSEEQRGFVAVVGLGETWADIATAEGKKTVDLRVFTRIYGGNAIILCDDDTIDPSPLRQGQGLNLVVRKLQDSMKKLGYFDGSPSGWYTPATTAAVMKFQRDHGLVASGEADGYTKMMLYVSLRSPGSPRLTP